MSFVYASRGFWGKITIKKNTNYVIGGLNT